MVHRKAGGDQLPYMPVGSWRLSTPVFSKAGRHWVVLLGLSCFFTRHQISGFVKYSPLILKVGTSMIFLKAPRGVQGLGSPHCAQLEMSVPSAGLFPLLPLSPFFLTLVPSLWPPTDSLTSCQLNHSASLSCSGLGWEGSYRAGCPWGHARW